MSTLNDAPFPFHRAPQPTDALAELFLGDGPLAPARATEAPAPRTAEAVARSAPHDNPEPLSIASTAINPTHDTDPASFPEPRVEALILGHLPVLASALP